MRFNLGKIPVTVRFSFFLITLFFAYERVEEPLTLVSWVGVVFFSVLWHELGHAFAFKAFGHSPSIELYQMGGVTRGTPGVRTPPGRHALISLAGPFAGFLLGAVVWASFRQLGELPPLGERIISDMIWVNVGWGIFNLLPIWPLDGGQALVGVLGVLAPKRGEQVGLVFSCFITACVVALSLYAGEMWLAFIAVWFGMSGFTRLSALSSAKRATAAAQELATAILGGREVDAEMHAAVETAMFYAGRYEEARALGELRFRRLRDPSAAYNVACCEARLERPESAIEWLERALDAGYTDLAKMKADDDLASLRGRPEFAALLVRG